jgi:Pentapeptide repeats (8 copies)
MSDAAHGRRWRDGDGPALAARVVDRLVAGEPLTDLPLDRHDGLVDLRGLAIPDPRVLGEAVVAGDGARTGLRWLGGLIELRGATLRDLDLSGARLEHLRFHDTVLRNCRFDRAVCRDWRAWDFTVEDCTFRSANLRGAALGTRSANGNHYRRVDFGGADLRDVVCQRATFEDCDLSGARVDKVEFGGCTFTRCRFAGLLDEVIFSGHELGAEASAPAGRLIDVDLSGAVLRYVEFRDVPLEGVVPPVEQGDQVVVTHLPCVVRRALARLEEHGEARTRRLVARLQAGARRLDERQQLGVWHTDELGEDDEQRRFAADLLHAVDRECAAESGSG